MKLRKQFAAILGIFVICASASATDLAVLQNGFSIRHEHREIIGSITRLYTGSDNSAYVDVPTFQIEHFERDSTPAKSPVATANDPGSPPAASVLVTAKPAVRTPFVYAPSAKTQTKVPVIKAPALNEAINSASDRHDIDPDLISSVIHAESGFNPRALSPKGAQGLMQLMPATAANLGVANAFDPGDNVEGGTRYLRQLLELYHFDLVKALAAYNAGPMRVKEYHGVPPYYETQAYVARIIKDFNRKKLAEKQAAAQAAKNKKAAPVKSSPMAQIRATETTSQTSTSQIPAAQTRVTQTRITQTRVTQAPVAKTPITQISVENPEPGAAQ